MRRINQLTILLLILAWVGTAEAQNYNTTTGNQQVQQGFGITSSVTFQNAIAASNTGLTLTVTGYSVILIHVASSPSMGGGTQVNFQGIPVAGATYKPLDCHPVGSATAVVNNTQTDGDFRCNVAGLLSVQAPIVNYSSGTVTVQGWITPVGSPDVSFCPNCAAGGATVGSAVSSSANTEGINVGGNTQIPTGVDADTGAGTEYVLKSNLVFRGSGGSVEAGTSSNPINTVFPSAQSVNCNNCTGSGASAADNAVFTKGTDPTAPASYIVDETTTGSVSEDHVGLARMTPDRKQLMVLVDKTTDTQRLSINAQGQAQTQTLGLTTSGTLQNGVTAAGAGSTQTVTGYSTVEFRVFSSPTMNATVSFDYIDVSGQARLPLSCLNIATGAYVTSTTVDGTFRCNASGHLNVSGPISSYVSGTITVQTFTSNAGITDYIWAGQSGTWNINNIAGTITLPTGAATATNQTTANSSLSSIDGKIPAAAALADGTSNPTVPSIGTFSMCFNGTTWDRCRSTASTATEGQVSCGTSSGTLKAANSARLKLRWKNLSSGDVYICYAATCTTGNGMPYSQNEKEDEPNYTGIVTCITSSGTSTVAYKEF